MLRKIASLGFIQIVGIGINIGRAKIFAVLLGPAGFGVVATIDQLVLSVVQISNLSLPFTALKFLSRDHSLGEGRFRRSYSAFFKAMIILSLVATLVTVVAIPANLERFDTQLAAFRGPVAIAVLGIPATMMLMFIANVLASRQESVLSVVLTVISGAVILIAGTAGCLLGGIDGVYAGIVPASTVLMIGALIFLWKKRNLPVWGDSSGVWREWTSNSQFAEITFHVYFAVASAAVLLLLARYLALVVIGAEAAGLLQACLAVALSVGAVLGPASALYFSPYVNRAIPAAEKIEAANRFLPRLVFLYCLGGMVVLLFPNAILTILFSEQFLPAVAVLPWFIAWQCLYQSSNVYQQLLIGLDDVRGYGLVTSTGNLTAAALCALLVDQFGLLGIAIGFVVGALITAVLTGIRLRTRHGLSIRRSTAVMAIFATVSFCVVVAVGRLTDELSVMGLLARSLTASAFLAWLWILLPRSLRSELFSAIAAGWRVLARR